MWIYKRYSRCEAIIYTLLVESPHVFPHSIGCCRMYIRIEKDPAFQSLIRWISTGPDLTSRVRVANNLARVYLDLHRLGVFHIDVKPEHIFISTDTLQVRVIDFDHSVVKNRYEEDPWCTRPYIAPEMRTSSHIDWEKWDIFVLGLIMIFLFTGDDYIERDIMGKYRLSVLRHFFRNCLSQVIVQIEEMTAGCGCVCVRSLLALDPSARRIVIVHPVSDS